MQEFGCFYQFMAMIKMENFLNVIEVHIYAYSHMIIEYFDFSIDF